VLKHRVWAVLLSSILKSVNRFCGELYVFCRAGADDAKSSRSLHGTQAESVQNAAKVLRGRFADKFKWFDRKG
jgi:hypothetical protein